MGALGHRRRKYHRRMDETGWAFWHLYAEKGTWMAAEWLGTNVCKCPLDLWMYQEILFRTRPDAIIETGTFRGGSALYLASLCDLLDNGRVITIDVEEREDLPPEGCYLIVEDTPAARVIPNFGPGPDEAVEEFLRSNESFIADPSCEKFLMTTNPGGYLKRIAT